MVLRVKHYAETIYSHLTIKFSLLILENYADRTFEILSHIVILINNSNIQEEERVMGDTKKNIGLLSSLHLILG